MSEPVSVRLMWLKRQDRTGRRYAVLRWTVQHARYSRALGYRTLAEADQERGDLEARLRLNLPASPPSTSAGEQGARVDHLVLSYLEALEAQRRGSDRYRRHELLHCQRIGAFLGDVVADRLNEAALRGFVAGVLREEVEIPTDAQARKHRARGVRRKSSILDMLGCLRRVFRHGRDVGLTDHELPRLPRNLLPDDARPPRALTEAEVARLISAAAERHPWLGRLVQLLAWCPRRPIALLDLRVSDCARLRDDRLPREEQLVYIRADKGGVNRGWCPLTEPARQALLGQLAELGDVAGEDRVWTSAQGRPLDASLLAPPLRAAAKRAGLQDVEVYDLRKFGASVVYARTRDLHVTQRFTGHRDVRTLFHYLSTWEGEAERQAPGLTWAAPPLREVGG
jgi:integrase